MAKRMNNRSIAKNISYIARGISRYLDQEAKHLKLRSATIPFLVYLYEHEGVHQDQMAQDLQFDKSSAARAVKALERLGYVNKVADNSNRRKNIITVTTLGRSVEDELYAILRQCTKQLFTGLSEEEIDFYFAYTEKVNENLSTMLLAEK